MANATVVELHQCHLQDGHDSLAEQIWTEGLNTNTTPFVLDPGLIEEMILENRAMSSEQAEDFRSLHSQHVDVSDAWRSSFAAYERECLSRTAVTAAACSETFPGEDELNGYCDFDRFSQTCRPAIHRLSLNRSLFKCVDMKGETSCNVRETQPDGQRRLSQTTNVPWASQCVHCTAARCAANVSAHMDDIMPAFHGGMGQQCEPCTKGGGKFALTLAVLGSLAGVALLIIRHLE